MGCSSTEGGSGAQQWDGVELNRGMGCSSTEGGSGAQLRDGVDSVEVNEYFRCSFIYKG